MRGSPFSITGALAGGALFVAACGGSPSTPLAPSPTSPTPSNTPALTGEVINALDQRERLPDVLVTTGDQEVRSDAQGVFRLATAASSTVSLTLNKAGFVERHTQAAIPGTARVSLIPSTFDSSAFEQFAPRASGLRRWDASPRLLVLKSVVDFSTGRNGFTDFQVTDREMTASSIVCAITRLRGDIETLTGGRFGFTDVEITTAAPNSRFRIDAVAEGAIVVMAARSLGANGRGAAYAADGPWVLKRGAMWLHADDLPWCSATADRVILHELGHALGYAPNHVASQSSIMGSPPTSDLTSFDLDAIAVLYQRPPGNRAPDIDPVGVVLGVQLGAPTPARPPDW